ncbi:MAG: ABC transporter ATP-binding protein/permease [Clostridia bacterium]|nr:ABC transporter ATP-binding protein/permease [Clostridia bacterium]
MLALKHVTKEYAAGENTVTALRDLSVEFRKSEFVSILGPSGCGKTTLLNIIGGLDRYTSGDLIIGGRSTKDFRDGDWDTYRNHSIGFVFQSYNLIPHQSVLANVELALTLSGVSRGERRRRATEALVKVGLGDQLHKRPSQMSGGQMQRVAIARALVNDPEILLADEPTGALDTETSVQVMEILKEISRDRLIIMVTHNPELAETYSSRIIRILDGRITGDTNPYSAEEEQKAEAPAKQEKKAPRKKKGADGKGQKTSMSFFTALSLSFNNLLTKKGRTFMTSFAGSIGIIGIALILSLSSGINAYIASVQEDTLSTYPLSLQKETQDMSAMLGAMLEVQGAVDHSDESMVYVDDSLGTMMAAMSATVSNNLKDFRAYLLEHYDQLEGALSDVQYTYDFDLQVFSGDGKTQINPTTIFDNMGEAFSGMGEMMEAAEQSGMSSMSGMSVLSEMIDNQELLDQQYEVVAGNWPEKPNQLVLVISQSNQISKMTAYMLGLLDQSELEDIMLSLMQNGEYDATPVEPYSFEDMLNLRFRLLNTSDFYEKTNETYTVDGKEYAVWRDVRDMIGVYDSESFVTEHGIELEIAGIVRPREGVTATSISGALGYTRELTELILSMNAESEVISQQKETPDYNVLTGLRFERTVYTRENISELIRTIDASTMQVIYSMMTAQVKDVYTQNPPVTDKMSFLGFVSFMSTEELSMLTSQMLPMANQLNPQGVSMLCTVLSQSMGTVTVTPENLVKLLPSMSFNEIMLLFAGVEKNEQIPFDISGLHDLCGAEAMSAIYGYMNEQIMGMEINDETFLILLQMMDDAQFATTEETLYGMAPQTDATLTSTLKRLGDAELADPAGIHFYARDFASKDLIEEFIKTYNEGVDEIDQIRYTDVVGILMSSVTTIVNVISYVLIAFVSISLVVSSIMIGIITYISVLERTKEIGILRAIGASKRDISRVFNAETLIVGLTAGLIGIVSTVLLCFPINAIVRYLTGIPQLTAYLPWAGAILLVAISMVLTIVAGLIPSRMAAKKDPVVALRSE